MRDKAQKLCLIGLLAVALSGCIEHEGQLAVLLSGAGQFAAESNLGAQQVNVEVTSVDLREADSGAYLTLAAGSQTYELLTLDDATVLALAHELTEGDYTHVRLTFSETGSSVITDAGRRRSLRIEPTTIEVPVLATVVEGTTSDVILLLDTSASLTLKANGEYWLRPVLRQSLSR